MNQLNDSSGSAICPGNHDEVRSLARHWHAAASLLAGIGSRMDGTGDARARWQGDAADSYRAMFDEHQAGVGRLSRLCEGSAALLLEWARQLLNLIG